MTGEIVKMKRDYCFLRAGEGQSIYARISQFGRPLDEADIGTEVEFDTVESPLGPEAIHVQIGPAKVGVPSSGHLQRLGKSWGRAIDENTGESLLFLFAASSTYITEADAGRQVTYDIIRNDGPRGPRAVRLQFTTEAAQVTEIVRRQGRITRFCTGYAFIQTTGRSLFSRLADYQWRVGPADVGTLVDFLVTTGRRGPRAVEVRKCER